jgi:FKBP-type peptidyl-prolyl cis-trans isomerase (trigger factor)
MNRHERRAAAAQAQKKQAHPTASFADLVADAQLNRLKPFIAETVQVMGAQLARQQLASQANILTRLTVLEKLAKEKLGETDETLAARTADEEDSALSFVATTEPATEGNMVRVSLKAYEDGQKPSEDYTRAVIRRLNVVPHQFHPDIEAALVGMKAGESKVVRIDTGTTKNNNTGEEKKNPDLIFDVRVDRVSVATAPPRPDEPLAPEADLQNPPALEE